MTEMLDCDDAMRQLWDSWTAWSPGTEKRAGFAAV